MSAATENKMTIEAERQIQYGSLVLDDPDPSMTIEKVKEFYAQVYPELTQSVIEGPEITEEGVVYKFRKSVGTKGRDRKTFTIGELAINDSIAPQENNFGFSNSLMEKVSSVILRSSPDEDPILPASEAQEVVM